MRSQPAETAPVARPPAASRAEYLRRRRSTPAGRQELRRFRRTALALAAYTAAVAAAVRLDLIAVTADEVTTAWGDLATERLLTAAAVKAAAALAVALTAPLAVSAARVAIRLRPWRPHSGTPAMWSAPPQRLQDTWPTWRAVAQAHMLQDHTPTTATPTRRTRHATLEQPTHSANEKHHAGHRGRAAVRSATPDEFLADHDRRLELSDIPERDRPEEIHDDPPEPELEPEPQPTAPKPRDPARGWTSQEATNRQNQLANRLKASEPQDYPQTTTDHADDPTEPKPEPEPEPEPKPELEPEPEPGPGPADTHRDGPGEDGQYLDDVADLYGESWQDDLADLPPEPKPEPEPELEPGPAAEPEPEPGPGPADTHRDGPGEDGQYLDDVADLYGESWQDDLADLPPEPEPDAPPEEPEAEEAAEPLVFWLCGPNAVSAERESLLALLFANNRRLHLKDGARILGLDRAALRMRLNRAAKDGWTHRASHAFWTLSEHVTTELEMLMAAVSTGEEAIAANIAAKIGPPLPALRDDWVDDHAGGATPREALRTLADDALASAAERWPNNPTFTAAVDRLYEDA